MTKNFKRVEFSYVVDPMNRIICLHHVDMMVSNNNITEPLLKKELKALTKKYKLKEDVCYKQLKDVPELQSHILETHQLKIDLPKQQFGQKRDDFKSFRKQRF